MTARPAILPDPAPVPSLPLALPFGLSWTVAERAGRPILLGA